MSSRCRAVSEDSLLRDCDRGSRERLSLNESGGKCREKKSHVDRERRSSGREGSVWRRATAARKRTESVRVRRWRRDLGGNVGLLYTGLFFTVYSLTVYFTDN